MQDLWVFGYGSLLWQPGFEFDESEIGRLDGYARSFCMRSIHHRGTEDHPGLVLALDEDKASYCDGIAFHVPAEKADETMTYLRERELVSAAYIEVIRPVSLASGKTVDAVCYVIDPHHVQYCGGIPLEQQAQIMALAIGGRGPNSEYLFNTATHLSEIGLHDADLDWLSARVKEIMTNS